MESKARDVAAYEKIREDHRGLKDLLARIDQALADRKATIAEVGDLLGQLGDRLVKHFALEEEGGYFHELMLRAPQLVARANALMAQHPKMCAQARELVVELQSGQDPDHWWKETRQRFDAFRDELLKHERNEDGLLQDAYIQDIGAHD